MNDTRHRRPDLSRLLAPRAVTVVGASSNLKSLSGQPLTHMRSMRLRCCFPSR